MGNINRTDDGSQQQENYNWSWLSAQGGSGLLETGLTIPMYTIPRAMQIQSVNYAATGITSTVSWELLRGRFITGSGFTIEAIGGSNIMQVYGTSGMLKSLSMPAAGNTLLDLQKNDLLFYSSKGVGAVTAGESVFVDIVLKNLQDVKSHY